MPFGPCAIGNGVAHMAPEGLAKVALAPRKILVLCGLHLFEHVGVAANRTLAKKDKAAGENVCAFYRNTHGHLLVDHAENILWA